MCVCVCACACVCMCVCMGGCECVLCVRVYVCIRVGTRLSHLGQPGHVLSRSTGSDLVYKISGSDPDFALDYMC